MRNLLSAVSLFLATCWALAANVEEAANQPPVPTVSMVYVVLFILLFLGLIVGFFGYLFWNEKRKTRDQRAEPGPT